MKILNLYSGIGGNRKLWGNKYQITAVEHNEKIASEYKKLYPKDKVIVADAHQYLLENYKEFDFIWSSPPCPTHSKTNYFTQHIRKIAVYPSMILYEEIIFLQHFYKGKFCVENVKSYYDPLIRPQHIGRHYLWANFVIPKIKLPKDEIGTMDIKYGNKACKKHLTKRNAVNCELGLHILNRALGIINHNKTEQTKLF
jgi:DNA (cytosine-5)-methyltransferase 1